MIADLTPSQVRLLVFMDTHGPRWFDPLELESIRLLEPGDALAIPSLIELGLVMTLAATQAVGPTAAGSALADEIRSEEARIRAAESKTDLLPCPFCGGEAAQLTIFERKSIFVKCAKCEAVMSRLDAEDVVAAWNRRTP